MRPFSAREKNVSVIGRVPLILPSLRQWFKAKPSWNLTAGLKVARRPRPRLLLRAPIKTGKKQGLKVTYDEGLSTHISPESCAGNGNIIGEALTGENGHR